MFVQQARGLPFGGSTFSLNSFQSELHWIRSLDSFKSLLRHWPVEYHIFPFGWVFSGIAKIRSFTFFNKY